MSGGWEGEQAGTAPVSVTPKQNTKMPRLWGAGASDQANKGTNQSWPELFAMVIF